ncbi:amino acid permease-domain-containing protein, partial [Linnemannia elongata]
SSKLGVFSGVFVPCVLSIWGIILFLRFGFIIAQAGVMGTMAMFIVGYAINIFTTLSLSAISTNGTVRGGGVYYLLSRSLGPEFGGSIGLIYFLGTVIGCGMNVLGFVEPLISNFGESSGTAYRVLPEGPLWGFVYGTILLVSCTLVCLVGSKLFSRASLVLAVIILLSTLSIFVSFAVMPPFTHLERNIEYTGFSWETLQENMWPKFTATNGPEGPKESFETVFGVLFPACIGILAGASMSGDLEDPSKSIPKGTLWAVGSTFCVYTCIVILMGGSISRSTMYTDLSVLQDVSVSPLFIASGALAASVFATLGSVIGAAKILQAIARDNLLPLLAVFGQGTPRTDEPTLAVLVTYILCQFCLFLTDMNAIATFVSMITLLTFLILNLACFLLKIGSAPNFRPSFRFFHWWTAFGGMVLCALVMGSVDLGKSLLSGLMTAVLFIWIHYWSPPKRWGDVTQSLIYHQVRKYLLRLDSRKEHVKFWRPQILLLVHHPRSEYHLIQFCNHLKKGALYVLGHVILGDLRDVLAEYRRQQGSWLKFVDVLQIKAFVNLSVADSVRIGARNLLIGTGLGGMRPNIVVMGSFNLERYLRDKKEQELRQQQQQSQQLLSPRLPQSPLVAQKGVFPTLSTMNNSSTHHTLLNIPVSLPIDNIRVEAPIKITDYVSIIEDVLSLNKAVAIGYGFERLDLPEEHKSMWKMFSFGSGGPSSPFFSSSSRPSSVYKHGESRKKKYIDLWPMQMSIAPLQCYDAAGQSRMAEANLTNFDTYTMVLQMGCILHMVPHWKENFTLRVMVFVEYNEDVEEEKKRLKALLENLRIPAEVKVMCLDGGDSETYDRLIKGEGLDEYPIEDMTMEYNSEECSDSEELESPAAPTGPYSNFSGQRDPIRAKDSNFAQRNFGSRGQNVPIFQASAPPAQVPQRRRTISHTDRPPIRQQSPQALRVHTGASPRLRQGSPLAMTSAHPGSQHFASSSSGSGLGIAFGSHSTDNEQHVLGQSYNNKNSNNNNNNQQYATSPSQDLNLFDSQQRFQDPPPMLGDTPEVAVNPWASTSSSLVDRQQYLSSTPVVLGHSGSSSSNAWNSSGLLAPETATAGVAPYTISPPNEASHLTAPAATATAVGDPHTSSSYSNSSTSSTSPIQPAVPMFAEGLLPIDTTTTPQQNTPPLQFDHLNPEAQLMILNELMRIHSSAETTSIVFTTVPAPEEGTCLREESSLAYLEQLDLLMEGIDIPVLLIHAKSLTVTMTL